MREDGFIVYGDPGHVARWLENDMKIAGYGHFLGMFHVGDPPHEKVMASKRLFARRQRRSGWSASGWDARAEPYVAKAPKKTATLY